MSRGQKKMGVVRNKRWKLGDDQETKSRSSRWSVFVVALRLCAGDDD